MEPMATRTTLENMSFPVGRCAMPTARAALGDVARVDFNDGHAEGFGLIPKEENAYLTYASPSPARLIYSRISVHAGLSGAVIAWDHELDEWLNPDLFKAHSGVNRGGEPLSPFVLATRVEAADLIIIMITNLNCILVLYLSIYRRSAC